MLHTALRIRNQGRFDLAQAESRKIPIYDEKNRPVRFPMYPQDSAIDNSLYGIGETLKRYAGLPAETKCYAEHGVFFGNHIQFDQKSHWTNAIITFSRVRQEHLRSHGITKPVLTIGPYISYARKNISEREFQEVKAKLGKVLLVFPGHSSSNYNAQFSVERLISNVERIRNRFDTVLVSCYYADIEHRERFQPYLDRGYRVVSAGHKFAPDFLDRLRTIISLADHTLSNAVGTHIGYCVALEKPHYLVDEGFEEVATNVVERDLYSNFQEIRAVEMEEVGKQFRSYSTDILAAQRDIVDKYWGLTEKKSPEELLRWLMELRKS